MFILHKLPYNPQRVLYRDMFLCDQHFLSYSAGGHTQDGTFELIQT